VLSRSTWVIRCCDCMGCRIGTSVPIRASRGGLLCFYIGGESSNIDLAPAMAQLRKN
jgi:hypothetical protein